MKNVHYSYYNLVTEWGETLSGVVKRFQLHIDRKYRQYLLSMKVASTISFSYEDQLARLMDRAARKIQTLFRERKAARLAKEEADKVVVEKKAERLVTL